MGRAQIQLIVFLVCGLLAIQTRADEAPPASGHSILQEKDKIPIIEQREQLRIAYYKPIYFLYGEPLTKVQFSFRAPLSEALPLNFAYSQVIFWELGKDSKPFLDATYNPEFFYRLNGSGDLQSVDFGFWEHNSNGKAGIDSRSYNQTYIRANYAFQGRRWVTQLNAKLKWLYENEETNKDIYDYIGPLDVGIKFLQLFDTWFDESELSANIRPGGLYAQDFAKGGYEIGLSFRFGNLKIIPAFYVQYFSGFGETLLNYDTRIEQVRVGLLF